MEWLDPHFSAHKETDTRRPASRDQGHTKGNTEVDFSTVIFARNRVASVCNFKTLLGLRVCVWTCLCVHAPHPSCGDRKTTSALSPRLPSCSRQGLFVVCGCTHQASWPRCFRECLCLLIGVLNLQACTTGPPIPALSLGIRTQALILTCSHSAH